MKTFSTLALALALGATAGAVQAQTTSPTTSGPTTGGPVTNAPTPGTPPVGSRSSGGPMTNAPTTGSTTLPSDSTLDRSSPTNPTPTTRSGQTVPDANPMPNSRNLPGSTADETYDDALEPAVPSDPSDSLDPQGAPEGPMTSQNSTLGGGPEVLEPTDTLEQPQPRRP